MSFLDDLNCMSDQSREIRRLKNEIADLKSQIEDLDVTNSTLNNDLENAEKDLEEERACTADWQRAILERFLVLDTRLDPDPHGRHRMDMKHRFEAMRVTDAEQIEV